MLVGSKSLVAFLLSVLFFVAFTIFNSASAGLIDSLQPGHWVEVPNSDLETLWQAQVKSKLPGTCGSEAGDSRAIMNSWNGGTFDSINNRLIVWGGGHNAYCGNEIYAFDINSDSWILLTNPSNPATPDVNYYGDGNPSSRHTYNALAYAANVDRFYAITGASIYAENGGMHSPYVDAFDFGTNKWITKIGTTPSTVSYLPTGMVTAYDSVSGTIFAHGGGGSSGTALAQLNPISGIWQVHENFSVIQNYAGAAVDPINRILVAAGGGSNGPQIMVWDISPIDNTPQGKIAPPTTPATTGANGAANFESSSAPGFVYDSTSKLFVGYSEDDNLNSDGGFVYTLDPKTWIWTKVAPQGSVRPSKIAPSDYDTDKRGTYGRFQYIPSKNAFVLVTATYFNVFYYKLTPDAGTTPAPSPNITSNNQKKVTINLGQQAPLTWSSSNADSCSGTSSTGTWSTSTTSGTNNTGILNTVGDATFSFSCTNVNGTVSDTVTVTVVDPNTPIVNLSIDNTTLSDGGSTTIHWNPTQAASCAATAGTWFTGTAQDNKDPTQGGVGESTGALSGPLTYSYTMTCTGSTSLSASETVTVTVNSPAAPAFDLTADGNSVSVSVIQGQSVLLEWSASNANSCSASWTTSTAVTGSQTVTPNSTQQYSMTCLGDGGSSSDDVTVLVTTGGAQTLLDTLNFTGSSNIDPVDWFDTRAGNSLVVSDEFKVLDDAGNNALGTTSAAVNIHSHYVGAASSTWNNYRYTGRMKFTGNDDGVGVTFYSDYPNSDQYYRLRREPGNGAFMLAPHPDPGGATVCSGTSSTSNVVSVANTWYWFKIEVENSGASNNVRAKVWPEGNNEPGAWQIDCNYSGQYHFAGGTIGVWSMSNGIGAGNKFWDDLKVESLSGTIIGSSSVNLSANNTQLNEGQDLSLSWQSENVTGCSAQGNTQGGWSGSKQPIDTATITSLSSGNYTFTLACQSTIDNSPVSDSVAVTVNAVNNSSPASTNSSDNGGGSFSIINIVALLLLLVLKKYQLWLQQLGHVLKRHSRNLLALVFIAGVSNVNAADIVNITINNKLGSTQNNMPITFGHAFKEGDVPSNSYITAKTVGGVSVPLQVDKKASHNDGSLRHAVVTAVLPTVSGNSGETIILSTTNTAPGGTPLALNDFINNSKFSAEVSINQGGKIYVASAQQMLQNGNVTNWLENGPLVSEWLVGGPIAPQSGGTPHKHLAVYFHIRAYGLDRVRVDTVVENNWTFEPNPTAQSYSVTLKVGGNTVYTESNLSQYHHTRWHKAFWWGGDPNLSVSHDPEYLQATKAVPNYQDGLVKDSTYLNGMIKSVKPMEKGNLLAYFGDTGADDQIGPLPRWDALYAVYGDENAYIASTVNATAGGSYSIHYRDINTGLPVSIQTYPTVSINSSGLPTVSGGNPNSHDIPHQPSIGYMAYLITGDYVYLEESQFWANFNMLWTNSDARLKEKGVFLGTPENRGKVWALRTLAQASYITPDNHPLKKYFVDRMNFNIEAFTSTWASPSKNNLGAIQDYDYSRGQYSPWQNDWFVWVFGHIVELGYNAVTMRDWLAQWSAGRMGTGPDEFCFQFAPTYNYSTGLVGPTISEFYPDFRTLFEANFGGAKNIQCNTQAMANYLGNNDAGKPTQVGEMTGRPYLNDSYYANMQPGLAIAIDAKVATPAQWDLFVGSVTPGAFSNDQKYDSKPTWAIVPRSINGPSAFIGAKKNIVGEGSAASLVWSSFNATSCQGSSNPTGYWTTTSLNSAGDTNLLNTIGDYTFTFTCQDIDGLSSTATATVSVVDASTPIVNLSIDNTALADGSSTTIRWDPLNATTCSASAGDWFSSNPTQDNKSFPGSESTGTLNGLATYSYAMSCTGNTGINATETVTVNVSAPNQQPPGGSPNPTIDFSASAAQITLGDSVQLSWTIQNADSCTADWDIGTGIIIGTMQTNMQSPTTNTTYTISCSGNGSTFSSALNVLVDTNGSSSTSSSSENNSSGGSLGLTELLLMLLGLVTLHYRQNKQANF